MVHGAWRMVHGAWCMVHGRKVSLHGERGHLAQPRKHRLSSGPGQNDLNHAGLQATCSKPPHQDSRGGKEDAVPSASAPLAQSTTDVANPATPGPPLPDPPPLAPPPFPLPLPRPMAGALDTFCCSIRCLAAGRACCPAFGRLRARSVHGGELWRGGVACGGRHVDWVGAQHRVRRTPATKTECVRLHRLVSLSLSPAQVRAG
eukprot:364115-Chlamydomonas_euryale.AAC.10